MMNPGTYYFATCANDASAKLLGTNNTPFSIVGTSVIPANTWGADSMDPCNSDVLPSSITITTITNTTGLVPIYAWVTP